MSTFHERKAYRTEYYLKHVYRHKLVVCGACNGSKHYDADGSPDCGGCDGTGKVRQAPEGVEFDPSNGEHRAQAWRTPGGFYGQQEVPNEIADIVEEMMVADANRRLGGRAAESDREYILRLAARPSWSHQRLRLIRIAAKLPIETT